MNYEEKEMYVGTLEKKDKEIKLRKRFGWVYVKDTHHGRSGSLHIVLQRDKDMKHYGELASLEKEYDECKSHMKYYKKVVDEPEDLIIVILLFLLFIFPLIIYLAFKNNQKHSIAEHNAKLESRMKAILLEADALE